MTNGHNNGLGLGLSIVRAIAEAHGSKIHIESTTDVGTTVRIVLPLAAGHDAADASSPREFRWLRGDAQRASARRPPTKQTSRPTTKPLTLGRAHTSSESDLSAQLRRPRDGRGGAARP